MQMIMIKISGKLLTDYSISERSIVRNHILNLNDFLDRPAFYLYAGICGVAALGMLTIDLNFKPPAQNLMKNVISLFKNVELDVLLVVSLIGGVYMFLSVFFI